LPVGSGGDRVGVHGLTSTASSSGPATTTVVANTDRARANTDESALVATAGTLTVTG